MEDLVRVASLAHLADRLRAAARELTRRPAGPDGPPPLYGVPVGVKDIIHVDGLTTRAGSTLPAEVLAGEQATVVDRLLRAGALIAGKTVTAEFAVAAPGPTRNPHHPDHTPGGSSSGSAAAVAAGLVPLALGTQTIGSVIRPAAYCGVVGFKPSHGRIPLDGVLPTSPTDDTLGTFTATVADAALAAESLCDDWHPERATAGRPVLGVPDGPYLGCAEPAALAAGPSPPRLSSATDTHGIDLWVAPAATGPAPHGLDSAGDSVMSLPWSAAGLPSLTLPASRSAAGLPLGLQCVGRHGADEQLLGWARDLESVLST